ncbi:transposase [Nocardia sp. NBC_01730]|uniref:transposase n=1 Tax=Nocardia sp. NBC_01730 TaxID=2975998 RepID=UPI002E15BAF1|nr:transposase [Nocardia sp. NBC_01730]
MSADAPKCGIDLGLATFAVITSSDGATEGIHGPKPLKAAQRALKRVNRKLARSEPDSNNRARARERVARLHLRVAERRRDFLHKTTTRLARTKSAIAPSEREFAFTVFGATSSSPSRAAPR